MFIPFFQGLHLFTHTFLESIVYRRLYFEGKNYMNVDYM